jgi:TP901 family phage tail tape measure protein
MSTDGRRINISFGVDDRELAKLMNTMNKVQNKMNQLTRNVEAVSKNFNSLSNNLSQVERSQKQYSQAMNRMVKTNQDATKSVKELQRTVDKGFNSRQIDQTGRSIRTVDNRIVGARDSMKGLNKYTLSFADATGIAGERMLQWSLAATGIYGTARVFQEITRTVIELDSQLIDFERLFAGTFENANKYMNESSRIAEQFGLKLTDVNNIMIEFGKQGLKEEDIARLTNATALLQTVGDIDATKATETMSALMNVFNVDARNATSIVDRLNLLADESSASVDDLSDAMFRSASVADTFGVSFDQMSGHITAIQEKTRLSGSVIGNALRTIYSRVTTMPGAFRALEEAGVTVFDPLTGDARDVGSIFDELGAKWDSLSDRQKQEIGVKVAGRDHLAKFLALMNDYDDALKYTKIATESWGTASKEAEKVTDKLQKKLDSMVKSFQDLSRAIGENGLGQALGFAMDSLSTLMKGLTGIFDAMGKWTWAMLGAVGATGLLINKMKDYNLETKNMAKLTGDVERAQAMNNTMTSEGISYMEHHNKTIKNRTGLLGRMSGAIGMVTNSLRGMAMALVTNPFFWIAGAVIGISALVGHFKKLKEEQKALNETTKVAIEQYKAFEDAIANGKVDSYQVEALNTSIEKLSDNEKKLKGIIDENYKSIQSNSQGYSTLGTNVQMVNKSEEELTEEYKRRTKVKDVLSKKQLEELAQLGINTTAKMNLVDLEKKLGDRTEINTELLQMSKDAMDQQRLEAIVPTGEAYFNLTERIDENSSAMENAIGFTDRWLNSMREQQALIELLSGVKNKDTVQTQIYDQAVKNLSETFGINQELLKKDPSLINDKMDKMEELMKLTSEASQNGWTVENKTRAQQLLTAENTEKTANRQKQAYESTETVMSKAYDQKMGKLFEYEKAMEDANGGAQSVVRKSTSTILGKLKDQKIEVKSTEDKFQEFKKAVENASFGASSSVDSMRENTVGDLKQVKSKTDETKSAWERLKEVFKSKIKGFAEISIKGIFGGLFGSGGSIDGDKMKDAIMSSGGGSIAGRGFGGLTFTSGFGTRRHPITGKTKFHAGIDLAGPMGTAIRARQGGTVAYSGWMGGYGNIVIIRGINGLEYRYAHNSANHVFPGQFVPAGAHIANMGSTGDSTGSHLHFEVRRGGRAINPTSYYHSGGIVSKKPRNNEVDARLQVGEMVINQNQQKNLFNMLNSKNGNDAYTGMGGANYTIKWGDTLSELAVKFKTTVSNLMKLNTFIKDADRIFAGQTLRLPGSSSSPKPVTPPKPKPMFANKDQAEAYLSTGHANIDHAQHIGIRNSEYRVRNLTTAKYREAYRMTGKNHDYNKMVYDELSQFSNANEAKKIFNQANVFLNATDKAIMLKKVLENVAQNTLKVISEKTNTWLDSFNKKVTEATEGVKNMVDISNQINSRKAEEAKDSFVGKYVEDLMAQIGMTEQVDPAEALQRKMDEIKNKIQARAEESALIQYRLNDDSLAPRLQELNLLKGDLVHQMNMVRAEFAKNGVTDANLIAQAQQPLKDRLAEIDAEYKELQNSIANGNLTLAENKAELEALANEYKNLQNELDKTNVSRREFTDRWGNIVRDAEGNTKMITEQGQMIMNTYEQVRKEIESVQAMALAGGATATISPILDQLSRAVEAYKPTVNATVETTSASAPTDSSTSETRTYQANSTTNRYVSYNVNAGVIVASRSEAREFAMHIKELIEEEEGRS